MSLMYGSIWFKVNISFRLEQLEETRERRMLFLTYFVRLKSPTE